MIFVYMILASLINVMILSVYLLAKTTDLKDIGLLKRVKLTDRILRYLRRSSVSTEVFIIVNAVIILALAFPLIASIITFKRLDISSFILAYMIATPFYLKIISRNRSYKERVGDELEIIMRTSHFLEKSGTEAREIYNHISKEIFKQNDSTMKTYIDKMISSFTITVDQREVHEEMKSEFHDIHEAVSYADICIQKIDTGISERLQKNQLDKIKENKLKKYKRHRRRNRTKLLFMSFFLLLSFCSVVVYPVFKDNLNNLPNILT